MDKYSQNFIRETRVIECPKTVVGRVIGKNGETIKALQIYTGALIQIDQTMEPMKINITGTQPNLNLAVSMVYDIIHRNFKGFALLRQIATTQNSNFDIRTETLSTLPWYSPGYGFIPPSQNKRQNNIEQLDNSSYQQIKELEALQQLQTLSSSPLDYQGQPFMGQEQKVTSTTENIQDIYNGSWKSQNSIQQVQSQSTFHGGQHLFQQSMPYQSQEQDVKSLSHDQVMRQQSLNFMLDTIYQESHLNTGDGGTQQLNKLLQKLQYQLDPEPQSYSSSIPTTDTSDSLLDGWAVICDPDGKIFYFNQNTGETSWQAPLVNSQPFKMPTPTNTYSTARSSPIIPLANTSIAGKSMKDNEMYSIGSSGSAQCRFEI